MTDFAAHVVDLLCTKPRTSYELSGVLSYVRSTRQAPAPGKFDYTNPVKVASAAVRKVANKGYAVRLNKVWYPTELGIYSLFNYLAEYRYEQLRTNRHGSCRRP